MARNGIGAASPQHDRPSIAHYLPFVYYNVVGTRLVDGRVPYPLRLLQSVGSALLLLCHPACLERSRRDRSGPIFSSAPPCGASPSPVIPTGATAPSAVAEWRDRGTIPPRRDGQWAAEHPRLLRPLCSGACGIQLRGELLQWYPRQRCVRPIQSPEFRPARPPATNVPSEKSGQW